MDVQTLAVGAVSSLPADSSVSSAQAVSSGIPAGADTNSAAPAQSLPAQPLPSFQLPHEVAKVFAGGSSDVTVSFQVAHNPNEIVTVFKNSRTGEVITQVPSEIMIRMAEFFDQVAGVVLDKTA